MGTVTNQGMPFCSTFRHQPAAKRHNNAGAAKHSSIDAQALPFLLIDRYNHTLQGIVRLGPFVLARRFLCIQTSWLAMRC